MYPKSNQPVRIYGTEKTHEFSNINETDINDLKIRPIIDETNTYTCHAVKAISDDQLLFTNIPVEETINYIIGQIYGKGRLTPICGKLIFKQLLKKLLTEVNFTLDSCFFKQIFI